MTRLHANVYLLSPSTAPSMRATFGNACALPRAAASSVFAVAASVAAVSPAAAAARSMASSVSGRRRSSPSIRSDSPTSARPGELQVLDDVTSGPRRRRKLAHRRFNRREALAHLLTGLLASAAPSLSATPLSSPSAAVASASARAGRLTPADSASYCVTSASSRAAIR